MLTNCIASYKSPIEFRKRNNTAAVDTSRFQYIATNDRSNGSVMVIIGSPTYRRKGFDLESLTKLDVVGINRHPWAKRPPVELVLKEDAREFQDILTRVAEGLETYPPEMCEEGLNGTYFLKDKEGEMIAVFKPQDEEGNSKNNPKRSDPEEFINKGILDGEGAQREVAAYRLDKLSNFVGVPRTTMVKITHTSFDCAGGNTKTGSLQEFIKNDGASWDIGFSLFPTQEVQKIAIFDLRIFNNDRHGGNMLLNKQPNGAFKLTPIDHGYSFPSSMNRAWFDWLTWPQAKHPFTEESKAYIASINLEKDLEMLQKLQIRDECLRTVKISTMLLQKGCQYGLNLFQLGTIASRDILEEPCPLEIMVDKAMKELGKYEIITQEDENLLLDAIGQIMDAELPVKDVKCK